MTAEPNPPNTNAAAKLQTALITGASGGIGYELAKLFARDHTDLVLVARSAEKLAQVAQELHGNFACTVKTIALDLCDSPAQSFCSISCSTKESLWTI